MSAHEEELLLRALEGDLSADEKDAFFAEHPELKEKFEELSVVRDVLQESGTEERESVAGARAGTTERDRRAVAEALRASHGGPRSHAASPVRPARGTWWLVAAAALVVALGVGVWKLQPQRPDSKLGTVQVECIEPLHDVSAWSRFVFRADGGRAVRYQVQVHERAPNGGRGKRLIQSDPLTEQVWIPSASDLAKLGDDIVWNVVVLDSSGDQQPGSDDVPVHRRR